MISQPTFDLPLSSGLPNGHHHWIAGNDDFDKNTLTPNWE
jgi:hypothetical protein